MRSTRHVSFSKLLDYSQYRFSTLNDFRIHVLDSPNNDSQSSNTAARSKTKYDKTTLRHHHQ